MDTMIEEFFVEDQLVPDAPCGLCGRQTDTQAYTVILDRPRLTRTWFFCSLSHLRQWAAPVR